MDVLIRGSKKFLPGSSLRFEWKYENIDSKQDHR